MVQHASCLSGFNGTSNCRHTERTAGSINIRVRVLGLFDSQAMRLGKCGDVYLAMLLQDVGGNFSSLLPVIDGLDMYA